MSNKGLNTSLHIHVYLTGTEVDYFTGGYTTYTHGSRDGGLADAMQLETRITGDDIPYDDAVGFGTAIADFYTRYYKRS